MSLRAMDRLSPIPGAAYSSHYPVVGHSSTGTGVTAPAESQAISPSEQQVQVDPGGSPCKSLCAAGAEGQVRGLGDLFRGGRCVSPWDRNELGDSPNSFCWTPWPGCGHVTLFGPMAWERKRWMPHPGLARRTLPCAASPSMSWCRWAQPSFKMEGTGGPQSLLETRASHPSGAPTLDFTSVINRLPLW